MNPAIEVYPYSGVWAVRDPGDASAVSYFPTLV